MKKTIIILITVYCSLVTAQAQSNVKNKNDLRKMNLKGNVLRITETMFSAKEDSGFIKKTKKNYIHSYLFNEQGNLTERRNFVADNVPDDGTYGFVYNEKGIPKEFNVYYADGSINVKDIYKYDNQGNLIELAAYQHDSLSYKYINTYDQKGNMTEQKVYEKDGSCSSKCTYRYDDRENQTEIKKYIPDSGYSGKETFVYNASGKMIENKHYAADSSILRKENWKYDDLGNTTEYNIYTSKGDLETGYMYRYDYDVQNNWIKQTTIENSNSFYINERKIEYY